MMESMQSTFLERGDYDQQQETDDVELDMDVNSDAEAQGINGAALPTAKLSSKKKEALSQVPCKFFRSNGCSAGESCPFAHIMPGEGQGKAVCQWFLKGSCRFGHKCALAHILPGQPMSMDRKNKRAAHHQQPSQLQAINGQGQVQAQQQQQQHMQQQQRMMLHEHIPLNDQRHHQHRSQPNYLPNSRPLDLSTPLFNDERLRSEEKNGSSSRNVLPNMVLQHREGDLLFGVPDDLQNNNNNNNNYYNSNNNYTYQVPTNANASQPTSFDRSDWNSRPVPHGDEAEYSYGRSNDSGNEAFGRPSAAAAVDGSTSTKHVFGTSPFSHPGSHSVFYSHNKAPIGTDEDSRRSLATIVDRSRQQTARAGDPWLMSADAEASMSNDVNEESFLPSSLSDLLTPAELQRRNQSGFGAMNGKYTSTLTPQSMPTKSVNGTSLWSTSASQKQSWLDTPNDWLGDGKSGSFSNAKGFFPKDGAATALFSSSSSSSSSSPSNRFLQPSVPNLSVSNVSAGFLGSRLRRGLSSGQGDVLKTDTDLMDMRHTKAYSPGAQAALSHAPGQSLPQGLAAGLSRLHLRPDYAEEKGASSLLQGDRRLLSGSNMWNHHGNGGMVGVNAKSSLPQSNDDLDPTAPSSMFAARTPFNLTSARSQDSSASTSYDALRGNSNLYNGEVPQSAVSNSGSRGTNAVLSTFGRSPAHGGIAIPSSSMAVMDSSNHGAPSTLTSHYNSNPNLFPNNQYSSSSNNNHKASLPSHPGMHRVRTAGTSMGSPLALLPTTGEEVEEPMFELE
ncbi:hypothetical protein CBS101457_004495 [Exobasidium rhododendri]|nr:hypothetical protein CBS101457_004495 [Exobasidium rhododendri]